MHITFHTEQLFTGAPIAGATIRSTPPNPALDPGPWTVETDGQGNFIADLAPGHYGAVISRVGYKDETRDWRFGPGSEGQLVRVGLQPATSPFKVSGQHFLDPVTNQRKVYNLCDCFPAYRFWLDGRLADLNRLADESHALGFDGWRIFGAGALSQNQVMDLRPQSEPHFYSEQPAFMQWLADRGLIGLWTVNVDMQVVMPDRQQRIDNFLHTCENFRNGTMLISGGNEHSKNGFDPNENPDPGPGIIWSRGSDVSDTVTPPNGATAAEFHQRRDLPKSFDDSVASATDMQYRQGFSMLWMDEPLGFDEAPSDSRSTDPWVAWKLARVYATWWALAVFHSSAGQRGQLLGPTARACAEAWTRGMQL